MVKGQPRMLTCTETGARQRLLKNVTGLQSKEKAMVPCPEGTPLGMASEVNLESSLPHKEMCDI